MLAEKISKRAYGFGGMSVSRLDRRAGWSLYMLLLPALVYVIIFYYVPMYGVQIAFKDYRTGLGIWGSNWVGFKHFSRLFMFPGLWGMIRNTLSITVYSLAMFPLGVTLALLLNELNNRKFKKVVQMVSYAPYFLSTVVLCSIVLLFLDRQYGVFNAVRVMMGLERISYISSTAMFSSIYVWSGVWQSMGWSTILYMAALAGVSPELVEAARIDGATKPQIIRHVNLPCILPTIIITFIMSTGGLLSVGFEKIYLLQNDLNLEASRVISTYTYEIGIQGGQFSYSSAIGFANTIVNILIICLTNYIARKVSGISMY